jgi:alpha-galactosidase
MLLSGDDLTKITQERLAMLKKLQPPVGVAARFVDNTMRVGITRLPGREFISVFNPDDVPRSVTVRVPNVSEMTDFWSGKALGRPSSEFELKNMPAHSARLFICT